MDDNMINQKKVLRADRPKTAEQKIAELEQQNSALQATIGALIISELED